MLTGAVAIWEAAIKRNLNIAPKLTSIYKLIYNVASINRLKQINAEYRR